MKPMRAERLQHFPAKWIRIAARKFDKAKKRADSTTVETALGPALDQTPPSDLREALADVIAPRKSGRPRRLSVALQGGGSFGAFSWGILDRLLEENNLAFDAISGASAGALNAVVMASGLRRGGNAEAKRNLELFWKQASCAPPSAEATAAVSAATRLVSPYQFNPFNLNPLRAILAELVDFDELRANPSVRLLIAATRVSDGKLRIFRENELSLNVMLASSCLPLLHHAVTIDGEDYWDGGYSANPPLVPLVEASRAADVLLVQLMPTAGPEGPTTLNEIAKRALQITFNTPLVRDLESISAMTKLAAADGEGSSLSRKLRRLKLHHIRAENEVPGLAEASALNRDWDFLVQLRDAGRQAAERWLSGS
jgi:NTE family protein